MCQLTLGAYSQKRTQTHVQAHLCTLIHTQTSEPACTALLVQSHSTRRPYERDHLLHHIALHWTVVLLRGTASTAILWACIMLWLFAHHTVPADAVLPYSQHSYSTGPVSCCGFLCIKPCLLTLFCHTASTAILLVCSQCGR